MPIACNLLRPPKALLRKLIQPERAAAEIERAVIGFHLRFQMARYRIKMLLASFLGFEEPRLAHDPQVLGDVVLRHFQFFGDFGHAQLLLEQQPQDAKPCFLAEGSERRDAIQSLQCDEYNKSRSRLEFEFRVINLIFAIVPRRVEWRLQT
jgi:hypothetical protein